MKVNIGPYENTRKVKVKIHDYDLYNLDHTLALIILPALKRYRKQCHKVCKDHVLDDMIYAFDAIVEGREEDGRITKGLELFAKYYRTLWT